MAGSLAFQQQRPAPRSVGSVADVELMVSLRVTGPDLDPAFVSRAIGVPATESARRGEVLREKGARQLRAATGTWFATLDPMDLPAGRLNEEAPLAPRVLQTLRNAPFAFTLELSFSLNGSEASTLRFLSTNSDGLARRMEAEAAFLEVDLDVPALGIDLVVPKGGAFDGAALRRRVAAAG